LIGDRLEVVETEGGWLVTLELETSNPQLLQNSLGVLLYQKETGAALVRTGTIRDAQEDKPQDTGQLEEEAEEAPEPTTVSAAIRQKELSNLDQLNQFFYEGRVKSSQGWQPFGQKEWEEGVTSYCSHLDYREAELIRSEYISDRKAAEDGEENA
jgi:hypothetical protein